MLRRFGGLVGFSLAAGLVPAADLGDPARDTIATETLRRIAAAPANCWGQVEESARPTILHCGRLDTADLKALRTKLDQALVSQPGVLDASGRWLWQNHREYYGRTFETETGPLEARIYYTKNLVGVGYVITLIARRVEALPCDDPQLAGRFDDIPDHDESDPLFEPPIQSIKMPAIYPERALAARLSGTVQIRARIRSDGSVTDVCVASVRPPRVGFEQAAVAAVQSWRYTPARYDGQPVEHLLETSVDFRP